MTPDQDLSAYLVRNTLLREMGFSCYLEYLGSDLWKKIRAKAFRTHGKKCKCCPNPADLIHHRQYDRATLLGRRLEQLVPVCRSCHEKIEFFPNGVKRSLAAVGVQLNSMVPNPNVFNPPPNSSSKKSGGKSAKGRKKTKGVSMPWIGLRYKERQKLRNENRKNGGSE